MKKLTRGQVVSRKEKAARFLETVVNDPDRAQEVREESIDSYAQRRGFEIVNNNPRRHSMRTRDNRTKQELADEVEDLQAELDEAYDKLDRIAGLASEREDEEEDEDEDPDGDDN